MAWLEILCGARGMLCSSLNIVTAVWRGRTAKVNSMLAKKTNNKKQTKTATIKQVVHPGSCFNSRHVACRVCPFLEALLQSSVNKLSCKHRHNKLLVVNIISLFLLWNWCTWRYYILVIPLSTCIFFGWFISANHWLAFDSIWISLYW